MAKNNIGLTVKISGQDVLDMKSDIADIKQMLHSGSGKISFNRKMIIGSFVYITTILGWLIGFKR